MFENAKIYEWFDEHLHLIPNHCTRPYVRVAAFQESGINWVQHLLADPKNTRLVAELTAAPSLVLAFIATGIGTGYVFQSQKKLTAA